MTNQEGSQGLTSPNLLPLYQVKPGKSVLTVRLFCRKQQCQIILQKTAVSDCQIILQKTSVKIILQKTAVSDYHVENCSVKIILHQLTQDKKKLQNFTTVNFQRNIPPSCKFFFISIFELVLFNNRFKCKYAQSAVYNYLENQLGFY